ncbi:MAG: hypothetical protein U9Q35_01205 [Pseudomonadota bacterium]|nr:hypothetical protein [Pseudomonadota bacterium]
MPDYDELVCLECERHLGWILYASGAGAPMCDACFKREEVHRADHANTN